MERESPDFLKNILEKLMLINSHWLKDDANFADDLIFESGN